MKDQEIMEILRQAIDDSGIKPAFIATRSGVSLSCVYAIMRGQTKWPRPNTLFSICDVVGLEMTLRKKREYHKTYSNVVNLDRRPSA